MPAMKRYKTCFMVLCGNGHQNPVDDRVLAESAEQAKNTILMNIQRMKCHWCDVRLTNQVSFLGQEELSSHPVYNIMGYICQCGERVEVLRAEEQRQFNIPDKITVQCSKGHSRTIQNREIPSLQLWEEETH